MIKRIVTHRFDNLPTRNTEFMGRPSDGKYVHMMTMPPAFGKLGAGIGPSNVLLEMQDQLGGADPLLREPFWYEVAEVEQVAAGLDDLSPRSKLLAATAAAANRQTDDDPSFATTEHWTKKVDPRVAQKQAAALAADAKARKDEPKPPPRVGQPDPDPHPLMHTNYKIEAQLSAAQMKAAAEHPGINPLTVPHGTHGYLIVFDLCDRSSFDQACQMAASVMDRAGYQPSARKAAPVTVCLIGNKQDLTARGKRSAISPSTMCELLASYTQPESVIPQLRKQKMASHLYSLVNAILKERQRVEESWMTSQSGVKKSPPKEGMEEEDKAEEELGGISTAVHRTLLKLKSELDPMRVSRGSPITEVDLFTAVFACLEHPLAEKMDIEPNDLAEAFLSCPAIGIKYVEVSCKTNHQIHLMERVVLRSLRLLEGTRVRRKGGEKGGSGGDGGGLFGGLGRLFGGGSECMKGREKAVAVS